MQKIYLDNSATTAVCPQAAQKALFLMTELYGNPSSLHGAGFEAQRELEIARARVAKLFFSQPEEVYFTSGGTEANNTAIFGAARKGKRRGNKIVTTQMEHPSVLRCMEALEREGFTVIYLKPDTAGRIAPDQLFSAIDKTTILVSMMAVNNEVGTIFPVTEAAKAIRAANAPALLHVDAVQAFGKLSMKEIVKSADLVSVSAHKLHGPKGTGALFIRKGCTLPPYLLGGGQEKGMRSGTQSTPLIAAFGEAVQALPPLLETEQKMRTLNALLRSSLPEVVFQSPESALPYILNFSVPGIRSETMLHFLSDRGIFVSSGSACSGGAKSHVLAAMGLPGEQIDSSLRVSFSRNTTEEEILALAEGITEGSSSLVRRS